MPVKLRTYLRYSISFLIAVLFLYFAFKGIDLNKLWFAIKRTNYLWIILLIPLNLLSNWVRAVRWSYLLSTIKSKISIRNLFSAVMIGYAVNNVLPRVGEFIRPYVIGKLENISISSSFGTIVIERILDVMSLYLIVCIVLFLMPYSIDPFVDNPAMLRPLFLLISIIILVLLILIFFNAEKFFRFISKIFNFGPHSLVRRLEKLLEKFYQGIAITKGSRNLGKIFITSFAIWILYIFGMYIPFFAFAELIKPELNFGAAVVLLTISTISWMLPAPGAIGTFHSFVTFAMVKLYNIDLTIALSYALLTHSVSYFLPIIFGIYYFLKDNIKLSELKSVTKNVE